jgi:hypothetical protein
MRKNEVGMSREEIVNHITYQQTIAAFEYTNQLFDINKIPERNAALNGFEAGAEWMQKKMIDKAVEWITEHIDIPYEGEFIDDIPVDYIEYLSKRLKYAKAVADAFKQAMEE